MMKHMEIVALEFDYSKSIIAYAMKRNNFICAGDLLCYLFDNEMEIEEDAELEAIEEEKLAKQLANVSLSEKMKPLSQNVSLPEKMKPLSQKGAVYDETKHLLHLRHCHICNDRPRQIVNLPCCHFSMCIQCDKYTRYCPLSDCGTFIDDSIQTFLA